MRVQVKLGLTLNPITTFLGPEAVCATKVLFTDRQATEKMAANNILLFLCVFISCMQKNTFLLKTLPILCLFGVLISCQGNKPKADVEFTAFDTDLAGSAEGGLNMQEYRELRRKHGTVFKRWFTEIMGAPGSALSNDSLALDFLNALTGINKPVFKSVQAHYARYPKLQKDIEKCIGALQQAFPDAGKFRIWSYFSQFSNYTTFADTANGYQVLGYSAEMFMNDTFALYSLLDDFPSWLKRYTSTQQIAPYLAATYLNSRFGDLHKRGNMLEEAVFQGKLWYSMEKLCPDVKPPVLFGYSEDEWKFLKQEEGNMWNFYVKQNVLFNTDFNQGYKRYFVQGDQTTGAGLPEGCPPRIGCYSGYRIIQAFADKTGASLADIWKETNASLILQKSGYNPIR